MILFYSRSAVLISSYISKEYILDTAHMSRGTDRWSGRSVNRDSTLKRASRPLAHHVQRARAQRCARPNERHQWAIRASLSGPMWSSRSARLGWPTDWRQDSTSGPGTCTRYRNWRSHADHSRSEGGLVGRSLARVQGPSPSPWRRDVSWSLRASISSRHCAQSTVQQKEMSVELFDTWHKYCQNSCECSNEIICNRKISVNAAERVRLYQVLTPFSKLTQFEVKKVGYLIFSVKIFFCKALRPLLWNGGLPVSMS